jgi:hypothetical protein
MAKLKSKDDPEWSSWKSSRLGHNEVAENNAKQKPCAAKQSEAEEVNMVMYLFNAQFSNSQSCCSSVDAKQFGTFCTGFVKSV